MLTLLIFQAAKMCKYTNYQKLCDLLFACFALTWVVTRLGVYPTWILYSTTIEAPQIVEMFPAYYIFNGLLSILLVLHVIWTYFILKIIYKAMYSGKVIFAVFNQCLRVNQYVFMHILKLFCVPYARYLMHHPILNTARFVTPVILVDLIL